ncbi:MAG: sodium:proline symporter [Deltaproteobacteria bacterium RBG_13_61_14]|nr:MAG: sodium:proline symporter [Deltaproteobacteria bacterium RBG_13_61_14]
MATLDWTLIFAYFAFSLAVGLFFSRRAGKSVADFFVSGRAMPWWLAGTSMVATTFSADTPLAVTEMVYRHGVAGNWLWWNFVLSGILTVFFYARLWRRVGVLTDIEFTELRYGGRPAAALRGFRALYLGVIINSVIMGWVISAMGTIVEVSLGIDRWIAVSVCLIITVLYSGLSGLWGVVVTDFFQFAIAMTGSILLAIFGLREVGGMAGLKERLIEHAGSPEKVDSFLSMLPPVGSAAWLPPLLFFTYIGMQWWASWYPGAEPGGGGYVAQRMFSAKDEKHSLLATLWFNIAHYALRPWPWIITALVAVVLYPDLKSPREGYVLMMTHHLPPGILGLMLASLAAAFMSTISTHINWGCSYLVKDFYQRFLKPDAPEAHYIRVSRLFSVVLMVVGGLVGYLMQSQVGGWELLLTIGAGTGLVYILRWFWWRINAWSEISAMLAALVGSLGLKALQALGWLTLPPETAFAYELTITVAFTTAVWLAATFLTRPESEAVLEKFFRRARPAGPGWAPVRKRLGNSVQVTDNLFYSFLDWIAGCALIYAALFGIGKLILGQTALGLLLLLLALLAGGFIYWDLRRRGFQTIGE